MAAEAPVEKGQKFVRPALGARLQRVAERELKPPGRAGLPAADRSIALFRDKMKGVQELTEHGFSA